MTQSLLSMGSLTLFLLSMTTLAALRSLTLLASINAISMICVPLLGAGTFTLFEYSTNVGNIFFATVMYGFSLNYLLYGEKEAHRGVGYVLFALVLVFGSIFILQNAQMVDPMFGMRVRIVGASFVVFCLLQPLFIFILGRSPPQHALWLFPVITIAIQGLDSTVFFPCAFAGELPLSMVLQFALVGWASKSVVALLSVPFLIWVGNTRRLAIGANA